MSRRRSRRKNNRKAKPVSKTESSMNTKIESENNDSLEVVLSNRNNTDNPNDKSKEQSKEIPYIFIQIDQEIGSFLEIFLMSQYVHVEIINGFLKMLVKKHVYTYKFSDFYNNNTCFINCTSAPHTEEEIKVMARIVRQTEYYFSAINVVTDSYLRSQMDSSGYVSCLIVYSFKKIQELNVTYDTFIRALEHSEHVTLSADKQFVKMSYFPEFFANNHFEVDRTYLKIMELFPRDEKIDLELFKRNLRMVGCYRRIAKKYNDGINLFLAGRVPDLEKYNIAPKRVMNPHDEHFSYLNEYYFTSDNPPPTKCEDRNSHQ